MSGDDWVGVVFFAAWFLGVGSVLTGRPRSWWADRGEGK